MISYVKGDLLQSNVNYICHQVNCQKVMGAGIAKQIKNHWSQVEQSYLANEPVLGTIQMVLVGEKQAVVNMYAQNKCGTTQRQTNYEAFYQCLEEIHSKTKDTSTIGFPYKIGCGLGGGDWDIILNMIKKVLNDRQVFIYCLEDKNMPQYKAKVYCCYSQTDIGRNINSFINDNPIAKIIDYSIYGDEVQWYLTIIYKE